LRVYVINQRNEPLMPTTACKARKLLKCGNALVVRKEPFTIKIKVSTGETRQEVIAGMDTGSKKIGCAAISNGEVLYQSEIEIRNNVHKKMDQRRMYRRSRRGRKTRYRKPRFLNRGSSRKKGRLAPSIRSKIDSHLREKKFVESILPVTYWRVETASFDIHKITNPDVSGKGYQKGVQKDFYNVKAYVLSRDKYTCQKCKTKKGSLHVHHLTFKSNGGTDTPENLITLCASCHSKLHSGEFLLKGKTSKTKHATEMGIIKSQLEDQFGEFYKVFGYETKFKREQVLGFSKTHYNDAVSICCDEDNDVSINNLVYYKKHVSGGDYQQNKGIRSEIRIPTGKLFGLRKFDYIKTLKGNGFIKGKRTSGSFVIYSLDGINSFNITVKKDRKGNPRVTRLRARSTTLIERVNVK